MSKIRIADIDSYPCLEVTGFVHFDEFIFYAVLFTPIELLEKNIRKLQYMLSVCQPGKISFDNTLVIQQLFNEIEKTESKVTKSEKYNQIGHWYFQMDNIEEALINYRKAIDNFPTHYAYLKEIIDFEFKNGSKKEALRHSSNLFDIEPKNPTVPQDLIGIFLDNGCGRLLADFFTDKLKEIDDKEIMGNLLFHKGLLFLNMSENGKAKKCFRESEKNFKAVLPLTHQVFKSIKQALKESKNGV
jgi:tetratricopeptide (TPR) repeat protein